MGSNVVGYGTGIAIVLMTSNYFEHVSITLGSLLSHNIIV